MSSQYVVIQYGDLFRGEFMNIGVFAFEMGSPEVKSKWLTNWSRVETAFGKDPILMSLVEVWKKIVTIDALNDLVKGCESPYSSIQCTPRRGSTLYVDQLLEQTAKTFLVE